MKKIYNGSLLFAMLIANAAFGMEELLVIENPPFHNLKDVKKGIENVQNFYEDIKTETEWAVLNQINKHFVAPWYYYKKHPGENPSLWPDASEKYQKWSKEAQDALGIPLLYQVQIKRARFNEKYRGVGGICSPKSIFLNESGIQYFPDSVQKYFVYHECAHVLHHDVTKLYLRNILPFQSFQESSLVLSPLSHLTYLGIMTGVYLMCRRPSKIARHMNHLDPFFLMRSGISFLTSIYCSDRYQKFLKEIAPKNCEKRADIAACDAMSCYHCILKVAEIRDNEDRGGYLSKEQLEEIAEKMKKENKLCDEHKNNNESNNKV